MKYFWWVAVVIVFVGAAFGLWGGISHAFDIVLDRHDGLTVQCGKDMHLGFINLAGQCTNEHNEVLDSCGSALACIPNK